MKKITFSTVAALCLMVSTSAMAASKIFAFAEYSQLTYDGDTAKHTTSHSTLTFTPTVADIEEKKNSFVVGAGYKLNDNISLIAGYGDFGTYSATDETVYDNKTATTTDDVTYSQSFQSVNTGFLGGVRIKFKMGRNVGLFGMGGLVYTTEEITYNAGEKSKTQTKYRGATVNESRVFFGGGVYYQMKNNMRVRGFWKRYNFETGASDAIGGGIVFSFK